MQTSQTRQGIGTFSSIGIITFILALLVTGLLVAVPAIATTLMSFQDFKAFRGFGGSPLVGLRNYQLLYQSYFPLTVLRSVQFAALSALVLFVTGTLAGFCLRALAPVRWLRHALCTLLLVPLLIPGELWAQAFFAVFPTTAVQSLAVLALWCGIKYVGLAALITTAALSHGNRPATMPLLSAGAVSLGLFALLGLPDYSFLRLMSPLSAMRDSMDLYAYRESVIQARFSIASAVTMSAMALRAILLAAMAFPVAALVRRLFPKDVEPAQTTGKDRLFSLLAVAALVLIAAVALVALALGMPAGALSRNLAVYPLYVIMALVGAAVNTALCWCLAWPVATAKPAGRKGATAVLLLLTALGMAPMTMGGYMQIRTLGMVNTYFPILLSGMGSTMGVWALVFAAKAMGVRTDEDWLKRMWRPALALLAVGAALRMNDTVPSMLYLARADLLHPLLTLSAAAEQAGPGTVNLPLAMLVTLAVPVALLLLVRTVFTERETVGLALPGK